MHKDSMAPGRWQEKLAEVEASLERARAALGSLVPHSLEESISHLEHATGLLRTLGLTASDIAPEVRHRLVRLHELWAAESELLGRVFELRLGAFMPVPVESHYTAQGAAAAPTAKGRIVVEG
jgi:hypothetical protein